MKRLASRLKDERATALVEFSLTAMLLSLLLFGVWDFGRILEARLITTNAAREAARYAAVYGADPDLSEGEVVSQTQEKAIAYLEKGLAGRGDVAPYSASDVSVVFPNGRKVGEPVQVSVILNVRVWPLMRQFFKGAEVATINSVAEMRI